MDDLFDEIRNDIAEEYNIRNENLTENELRSDLKHKIEKEKRKRKLKEKQPITLSSDSENEKAKKRNKERHHRKVSLMEKKRRNSENSPIENGPKVVFNPLTKSYESNIPVISRYDDSPKSPLDDERVPTADDLVNELVDEVSQDDRENIVLTDKLSNSKRRKISREPILTTNGSVEPKVIRRKSSSFTHPDDDVTPTRDETIESRIQAEENLRERLSSSEAIQETKIKSRWGGDTSDEDDGDIQSKNQVQKQQEIVQADPDILKDLYPESGDDMIEVDQSGRLEFYHPAVQGCRQVDDSYKFLNRVAEGTYGVVFRAEDKKSGEICALKRLKMEKEREGFPITSLREIVTLLKAKHENVINVMEICVGSTKDKIFIAMEFLEHDLKGLMETMKSKFTIGEVKTLMHQLMLGVDHLHDNWILHRDLKTSNLLLNHRGVLKIADFGLAREYGSPLNDYTQVVVTLWYRCPELLLGQKRYSTYIDIWSCGCIMGEFLQGKPLFPGKTEQEQVKLIFKELGTPDDKIWPGFSDLPHAKKVQWERHPHNMLRKRYKDEITKTGYDLMKGLLCYSPEDRMTARQALDFMERRWFQESPIPTPREYFPTWPAKSELNAIRAKSGITMPSPDAPTGAAQFNEILKSSMGNM